MMLLFVMGFIGVLFATLDRWKADIPSVLPFQVPFVYSRTTLYEGKLKREQIEQALIEVCRSVYYTGYANGCLTNGAFVWSFLLDNGVSGNLSDVYSLPSSSAFTCANPGNYGRFLLSTAVPQQEVQNFTYNLNGLDIATTTDPCAHGEIVGGV